MDELIFSGKKYISSKRAAALTGYAKDYVGQLARAGKIPGTRVGRAWYVEEDALLVHVKAEDKPEISADEPIHAENVVAQVQSVAQTAKPAPTYSLYRPASLPRTWSSVTYHEDNDALMPMLSKRPAPAEDGKSSKNIVISPIQKEDIKIKKQPVATHASQVRMQVLMDGIQPPQPVLRVARPARHAPAIKETSSRSKGGSRFVPAVLVGALSVIALSVALSGLFVSSSIEFSSASSDYSAGVLVGFENILEAFKASQFYQEGIGGIDVFFSTLSGSFFQFLDTGISFLKNL